MLFLYPDVARDEAFGPYYSQRQEGMVCCSTARHGGGGGAPTAPSQLPSLPPGILTKKKEYLNQRLIRVSSR